MKSPVVLFAIFLAATGFAQDAAIDVLLANLRNPDVRIRLTAIGELQTSLDPRIPAACLQLLQTERDGQSVLRLAARAVGSRWTSIPEADSAPYIAALNRHLGAEHDGLAHMARRGIALLSRDYRDPMVSTGPTRRWVIYERHGLPCLIDTSTGTEELLGWTADEFASFMPSWGNEEVAGSVRWHTKGDAAALDMLIGRKAGAVWIWRHRIGVRKFGPEELIRVLAPVGEVYGPGGFFTEIQGWDDDDLGFTVSYVVEKGDDLFDHEANLRWNLETEIFTVVSDVATQ